MSLQGLVNAFLFWYNFWIGNSPNPHGSPQFFGSFGVINFSRYTDKSEVCFLSKTPQKKYKERWNPWNRCSRSLCSFRVATGCDWSSLGGRNDCKSLLSPQFCHVSERSPEFSAGQNNRIRFESDRILRNAHEKKSGKTARLFTWKSWNYMDP